MTQELLNNIPVSLNLTPLSLQDIKIIPTEYGRKFSLTAYYEPLNLRAIQTVRKQEPDLVTLSHLNNSKQYEEAKELLLCKLNFKLNEVKNIIQRRLI